MKNFLKTNKEFWNTFSNEINLKGDPIIVDILNIHPGYVVGNLITAKYLQKHLNVPIIALITSSKNKHNIDIADSFGIDKFLYSSFLSTPFFLILKSALITLKKLIKIKHRKDVLSITINEIQIGDLIYDSYLRNTGEGTITKINIELFKSVFEGIRLFLLYQYYYRDYNIQASVQGHLVYNQFGSLARLLASNHKIVYVRKFSAGAFTIRACIDYKSVFKYEFRFDEEEFESYLEKETVNSKEKIDSYINRRFNVAGRQDDLNVAEAYGKDKVKFSGNEFIEKFNLNDELKTACIMSHVFPDAPHSNSTMLFDDYYDWLLETLNYVKDIKNVNWIIKPHPANKYYNSKNSAKDAYNQIAQDLDNVILLPDDINTSSLFEVVDVIVTVAGTAGLEFACMGIPSILAGESPYSGHGFTIDPIDRNSYFDILSNIDSVKALTHAQIEIAKYYFYLVYEHSRVDCIYIPNMSPAFWNEINEEKIYSEITLNLKKYSVDQDPFYNNFMTQLENKNPHLYKN